eukprot:COSAG01_NODE_1552_length_9933_cov_13.631483_12_plen_69_part_00
MGISVTVLVLIMMIKYMRRPATNGRLWRRRGGQTAGSRWWTASTAPRSQQNAPPNAFLTVEQFCFLDR